MTLKRDREFGCGIFDFLFLFCFVFTSHFLSFLFFFPHFSPSFPYPAPPIRHRCPQFATRRRKPRAGLHDGVSTQAMAPIASKLRLRPCCPVLPHLFLFPFFSFSHLSFIFASRLQSHFPIAVCPIPFSLYPLRDSLSFPRFCRRPPVTSRPA